MQKYGKGFSNSKRMTFGVIRRNFNNLLITNGKISS